MQDVAAFLAAHAPFDALDGDALAAVATAGEIEFFAAGAVVFAQGAAPEEHVRVVRSGAVELIDHGRVLDLLGEGELFGHPSMLSGLPTGLAVRAHEDALVLRLPRAAVLPVLAAPAGLAWTARSLQARGGGAPDARGAEDPAARRVATLVRSAPVIVAPDVALRETARRMTDHGVTSAVVDLGDGRLGILTDRDLRSRVVTGEVPVDAPVRAAMTPDAWTVDGDRLGSEVVLEMLERGVRHAPVRGRDGRIVGVLDDLDLLAAEGRAPFRLRRAIDDATEIDGAVRAAQAIRPTVAALHGAGLSPRHVGGILAIVTDALVRRLVTLAARDAGPAPAPVAWLALGSLARREGAPGSDVDSALAWEAPDDDAAVLEWTAAVAARVLEALRAGGLRADAHGVAATDARFARSVAAWRAAIHEWVADPARGQALIYVSALLDARAVTGEDVFAVVLRDLHAAVSRPAFARLLGRLALAHRPPTGFLRGVVVEHSGAHGPRFDVKTGGLLPVADVARWAAVAARARAASTPERLRAAAAAGVLREETAGTLEAAFDLFLGLRLDHQVAQLRAGRDADDVLDPSELDPLTRRHLREAFRAVAGVQRRVQAELALPP